jgi:hypothetical protein
MWPFSARCTVLFAVLAASCSSQQTASSNGSSASTTKPPASAAPAAPSSITTASASAPVTSSPTLDAGAVGAAVAAEETSHEPTFDEIANVLFADKSNLSNVTAACPSSVPEGARVRCLFDERYRGDSKAASLAHELFVKWRIVSGVEVAHTMDGGYRGMIKLEPALPVGAERKHIEWIAAAMRDIDQLFTELEKFGASSASPGTTHPKRYRFKPLTLRFMRSVAMRTPSAYAHDWTVSWNLAGSLHTSGDAVRETLVHEIFHLNDYAHPPAGGEAWSFTALGTTFNAVVKKCGTAIPCLGPYTPNETIVRNGTYYSFQPGNGVREYAAELALRYFREQRAALRSLPKVKPFKCGPPENARSWALMRDEFWNGIDAVPACGS